jgi:uncharacterized membrane protein
MTDEGPAPGPAEATPTGDGEPADADVAWFLDTLGRVVQPEYDMAKKLQRTLSPAWRRVTGGEQRWQVTLAVLAAIALQLALPRRLVPGHTLILPLFEGTLLVALTVANPRRITRSSPALRSTGLALIASISIGNTWSVFRLVRGILQGVEGKNATALLLTGGAIWLGNVLVFALWYWEFDRGGPVHRALATSEHPDLMFPQMTAPELAAPDWEPRFVDYLYMSFTNATAFSPTDVMPLARWAKLTMLLQSAVSLAIGVLVIARAVNIL